MVRGKTGKGREGWKRVGRGKEGEGMKRGKGGDGEKRREWDGFGPILASAPRSGSDSQSTAT